MKETTAQRSRKRVTLPPPAFVGKEVFATFSPSPTRLFKLNTHTPLASRCKRGSTKEDIHLIKTKEELIIWGVNL